MFMVIEKNIKRRTEAEGFLEGQPLVLRTFFVNYVFFPKK